MYARPDFAVFVCFLVLYVALTHREKLFRILAIAVALYAPWIVFTTLYYGSPVPNTIVAKSLGYSLWTRNAPLFSTPFWSNVWVRVYDHIFLPLGPSFAGHGAGFQKMLDNGQISHFCFVLLLLGSIAMLLSFDKFYVIVLGVFAAYSAYYIFFVPAIFGWYLVPFSAVNCLLLVFGLGAIFDALVLPSRIPFLSGLAFVSYITPFLVILPTTFRAEHDIQQYIETPVRMEIGKYLLTHKKPGDAVGCEPLGYIAYYSRMPVYDYPGLASPEVTAFLKQHPDLRTLDRMLEFFKPNWIVLREREYQYMLTLQHMQFLRTEYAVEKVFRSDPVHTGEIFRIGNNIDLTFTLLKKERQP
jgi:hypothetical protein